MIKHFKSFFKTLDPDSESGSRRLLNPDPKRCLKATTMMLWLVASMRERRLVVMGTLGGKRRRVGVSTDRRIRTWGKKHPKCQLIGNLTQFAGGKCN